jgi:hypothetical protein
MLTCYTSHHSKDRVIGVEYCGLGFLRYFHTIDNSMVDRVLGVCLRDEVEFVITSISLP